MTILFDWHGLRKIISGGQDGVDLGALVAAKASKVRTGGWAPKGYRTAHGLDTTLHALYGLTEHTSPLYPPRTKLNVLSSDATLIIASNVSSAGTALTVRECAVNKKPYKVLEIDKKRDWMLQLNVEEVADWVVKHQVEVLNVAGNHEDASYHSAVAAGVVQALILKLDSLGLVQFDSVLA